jgi:hypothetical protein
VTNEKETLEVDQDYYYEAMDGNWALDANGNPILTASQPASPYYATPFLLQSPRSVQLGVKFTY